MDVYVVINKYAVLTKKLWNNKISVFCFSAKLYYKYFEQQHYFFMLVCYKTELKSKAFEPKVPKHIVKALWALYCKYSLGYM